MADTQTKRRFRTTRDGISLERQIGSRTDPRNPGREVPVSRVDVVPAGRVFDDVAPHLVARYDEGDEHVRSLLEEVDEDEKALDVSSEDHEALQEDLVASQERVNELEAQVDDLQTELDQKNDAVIQANADLDAARSGEEVEALRARMAELEQQLEDATAPSGDEGDQFDQLDENGLKEAGQAAGYPKLGDTNWSQLDDAGKRQALREAAAAAEGGGASG